MFLICSSISASWEPGYNGKLSFGCPGCPMGKLSPSLVGARSGTGGQVVDFHVKKITLLQLTLFLALKTVIGIEYNTWGCVNPSEFFFQAFVLQLWGSDPCSQVYCIFLVIWSVGQIYIEAWDRSIFFHAGVLCSVNLCTWFCYKWRHWASKTIKQKQSESIKSSKIIKL